jgi:hypothetical protein
MGLHEWRRIWLVPILTEVTYRHGLAGKTATDARGPDGGSIFLDKHKVACPVLFVLKGVAYRFGDSCRGREGICAVLEQKLDHVPFADQAH